MLVSATATATAEHGRTVWPDAMVVRQLSASRSVGSSRARSATLHFSNSALLAWASALCFEQTLPATDAAASLTSRLRTVKVTQPSQTSIEYVQGSFLTSLLLATWKQAFCAVMCCRRMCLGSTSRVGLKCCTAADIQADGQLCGSASRLVQTMPPGLRSRALWTFSLILLISMVKGLQLSSSFNSDAPQDLFSQIAKDLSPYRKRGISDSMTNGVYCGIRDPGFRVQIKDQEVYIVGEVEGFQSRNRNIKLALVDVAAEYADLPDVDFVVGTYDWTATEVQPALGFEEGGPVLCQVCKASCTHLNVTLKLAAVTCCMQEVCCYWSMLLPSGCCLSFAAAHIHKRVHSSCPHVGAALQ